MYCSRPGPPELETTIPGLLIVGAIGLWWHSAIQALDRARDCARAFCRRQGWQLLDQTVSLGWVRPARGERGLCLKRRYQFEFSSDGSQRHAGGLSMLGTRPIQVWADGPDGRIIIGPE